MSYTKKDEKILTLISNFCKNECPSCQDCPEEDCVLYNIEQVIVKDAERRAAKTKKPKEDDKINTFAEYYCRNNPNCVECNLEEQMAILDATNLMNIDED